MSRSFLLIPGRSSRQGTSLNEGKESAAYLEEIRTVLMAPEEMQRLGLADGDSVRVWNDVGSAVLRCQGAAPGELPENVLFLAYGDASSRLMGGETHGSGMPDSKGIDVWLERGD